MAERSTSGVIQKAHFALDRGDSGRAVAILEDAIGRTDQPEQRCELLIELAAACLLAGDEYLLLSESALDAAVMDLPETGNRPLLQALRAEQAALAGYGKNRVRQLTQSLRRSDDRRAGFHAASALLLVEAPEAALRFLRRAQEASLLPRHLEWRSWSLTGVALEQLGDYGLAAKAIRQAVAGAPAGEFQELERLALADCLLELGDAQSAATELAVIDHGSLQRPDDHVYRCWLMARAEQELGNPGLAIQHYRKARELMTGSDVPPFLPWGHYQLLLAEAQLLADRGAWAEAVQLYQEACAEASPEQVSLTRHELAVVLIESGDTETAAQELAAVVRDNDYQWRAEAIAELADLALRRGDNQTAERLAHEAIAVRPVPAAYLCLGSMAFEYYRLEEAVGWFELAAEEATDGDPAWVAAQQLLTDALAQMGPDNAEKLYLHAQLALKYTDRRNDWYLPLRSHADSARRALAGQRRLVN